jgi:actin beta/gamma 1
MVPEDHTIIVPDERRPSPELLFKPGLDGLGFNGPNFTLFKSILNCPITISDDMFGNSLLPGGTTLCKGMCSRVQNEIMRQRLNRLTRPSMHITVIPLSKSKSTAWMSSTKLANLPECSKMLITQTIP